MVGFFNGDLKVFDKNTHAELFSARQLHQDTMIEDALFLKNDQLDKKLVVTIGSKPNAELKVSEIIKTDKSYSFATLAVSREELNGTESFSCLSHNPLNTELICSGGIINQIPMEEAHTGILIWKLNNYSLNQQREAVVDNKTLGGPTKRVKTEGVSQLAPFARINCHGGISSLKWSGPNKIFAGCQDHNLKVINVEKQQVEEVLFTQHKVPTCLDSSQESTLITGHEDGVVRLWDVRSSASEKTFKAQYDSHGNWVSQVKFNPTVDNLFLSGGYDGTVKLWDLRNEESPVATLKKKDGAEEYKVMAVEWNGPSQIISGGSDSVVSVHTISA